MASDDRPQYQHGTGTIGGTTFHWGSGTPGRYWSLPYGDYPVTPNAPTGAWAQSVGAIPVANNVIPDPKLGRNRIGIMIHSGSAPDLDTLYTQGCFKVAPSEWPAVRQEILKEAKNGPLYLHVAPGGVAAFTNTAKFSQASEETPAANANAAANTTAANSAAGPTRGLSLGTPNNNFLSALAQIESNNQNVFSRVDKDYPGQPGSRSQGYYQIDTPTWQQFAAKAGIDVEKYPSAMSAPQDVQAQVASLIPLSRFGGRTQRLLGQQFGQLDASKPIGQLGTTLTTVPQGVVDPSIVARGGTSPPLPPDGYTPTTSVSPSIGEALKSGDVGGALKAALTKSKDAQGVESKSPLEKLAGSFGTGKTSEAPAIPEMHMASAPAADPMAGLAPAAQQLFTTVSAAAAKPLSWSSAPYGAGAGQVPGMTLNQSYPYG